MSAPGVPLLCPTLAAPPSSEPCASCVAVPMSAGQDRHEDRCCLPAAPGGVSGLNKNREPHLGCWIGFGDGLCLDPDVHLCVDQ